MYYSIAGRDIEREVVPLALDQGLGILPWSPLAGGFLTGKFKRDGSGPGDARRSAFDFPPVDKERAYNCVDAMQSVASEHGCSVARIALAYILGKPGVTSVIIGAKRDEQLRDNVAATEVALTDSQRKMLDDLG